MGTEIAKLLLENGAKVNQADTEGRTPLNEAAEQGHTEITNLLLKKGADPNNIARKSDGSTPLHYAANAEIAKLLLDNGAKVNQADNDGYTPLDRATNDE